MVFKVLALLRFTNNAQRTAGRTTIANAISGRNATIIEDRDHAYHGTNDPSIAWEAEVPNTGDAGIIYALIQAMTTPLPGSVVYHHTCRHDEGTGFCLKTAEKVW